MLISLLLFSAPILLVIADSLLPSALLSASLSPSSLNLQALSSHLNNYDFRSSLIDIPLISIIRSAIILCVYSFCDGPRLSRGPYLGVATICSVLSLVFVSLKAAYVFSDGSSIDRRGYSRSVEVALFVCSFGLAIGHVIVAYKTSCRERRKLLVYKIDIEAVSACKNGFLRHQKIVQGGRAKPRQKQISIPHFFLNQIQFSKIQVSDLSKGDVQPEEERSRETQKL
ncbi:Alpha/beta hydrolase related protein [Abeliophyllum distichum]|uniref:Alpha/beta hydrolase related protein n=1 Tax=Abeliophyllum distichum TaxID=126358 RepID=A0ABD1UPP7_9LAMI